MWWSMTKQKSIPKNVSMYPSEWAVVEAVMKKRRIEKLSQALQFIVKTYPVESVVEVSFEK